jgi:CheY-like chemotaxis protein
MAANPSARKILVIDDDPVIVKALFLALNARGHEVYAAIDGPEAFSIARREKLDLILLDFCFPPDVIQSGNTWDAPLIIDWLRRIGVGEQLPIVIISGVESGELEARCLAAGATAFFPKPLDMPRILETIREILARQPDKTGRGLPVGSAH